MGLVLMIRDKVDSFDFHVVRSGTCNFHMLGGHKPFQQLNHSFQTVLNKLDTGHQEPSCLSTLYCCQKGLQALSGSRLCLALGLGDLGGWTRSMRFRTVCCSVFKTSFTKLCDFDKNESQFHESVLMNPTDEPLDDKRGTNIEFEFYSSYENYDEFLIRIADGDIKGKIMQFKKQDKDKYRYYRRYLSKETQNSAGHCFVSIEDHSNHPEQEKEQLDKRIVERIVEKCVLVVIGPRIMFVRILFHAVTVFV
ncbi:hypothetical protein BpHYR1_048079 [Brachionus plicatilis]|uniref:Uncharacterized protein n=1 Tax=Brachionus plicatilis TaxID=10195 RepID=A0A3M7PX16_BRAPC|nr:hypothetical protein BpHYR1_048079 [Brachionus plicatilis]